MPKIRIGEVVWWAVVALFAGWAAIRVTGLDSWYPAVQLIAFTPYVAALAVAGVPLLWLRRRYPHAVALGLVAAALAGILVPRLLPDGDPLAGATGPTLRVATANLFFGEADPAEVVAVVRDRQVDLLAVQEMTPQWLAAADAVGLGTILPRRFAAPGDAAEGSAIFTHLPLRGAGSRLIAEGWFQQVYGVIPVTDRVELRVESAHAASPYSAAATADWRTTLRREPRAGSVDILLGDFNATLDHRLLRDLIGSGYRDAADVVGTGLVGTWPYDGDPVPPVTLDHILVGERIGVRAVDAYRISRADHRMLVAELVTPAE